MKYLILISFLVLSVIIVGKTNANTPSSYQTASISLVNDGNEAMANNETEKAVIFFQQAMVANPQNTNAYVGLGGLYSAKGRYSLGLKYYDIALSIDPIDIFALEGSVLTNLKRQDLKAAEVGFNTMKQVCEVLICEQLSVVAQAIEAYHLEAQSN